MLDPIKVAMVTTHPPSTGSLTEYAFHFVRCLKEKAEVSDLVLLVDELPSGADYPPIDNVTFDPCWRFGALNNATRIANAVQHHDPDVVLFNIQFASFGANKVAATLGLMAPAAVKRAGYPTIVLLHNIMETVDLSSAGFAGNALMEAAIRGAGTLVTKGVLSADYVALTIPKYVEILQEKYNADNVLLAPHGSFESSDFVPDFNPPADPIQIMTFGKFGTYKKVEGLVEAFKLLQTGERPPLRLVIAGSDSPNAPDYLKNIATRYADVEGIEFTGYVAEEDVPRIFNDASVVVFPYTSTTGSSGVLHQAGDYGKAVVLPNIGDFAEVITEEGYTGEFFEPDDVQSLATAIANVIDNPARRDEIGQQNFAAARGIPIDNIVDWYLLHFQTLLSERSAKMLANAQLIQ